MDKLTQSKQQLRDYVASGRRSMMYMSHSTYKKLRVEQDKYINISPNQVLKVTYLHGDIEYINYNDVNYPPYWTQLKTHEWLNTNFKIVSPSFIRQF